MDLEIARTGKTEELGRPSASKRFIRYTAYRAGGEHVAREGMLWFVLYVVAFALGIASFIISVLSAASYTAIGALLSIAVLCLGFAGISSGRDNAWSYSRRRRLR